MHPTVGVEVTGVSPVVVVVVVVVPDRTGFQGHRRRTLCCYYFLNIWLFPGQVSVRESSPTLVRVSAIVHLMIAMVTADGMMRMIAMVQVGQPFVVHW